MLRCITCVDSFILSIAAPNTDQNVYKSPYRINAIAPPTYPIKEQFLCGPFTEGQAYTLKYKGRVPVALFAHTERAQDSREGKHDFIDTHYNVLCLPWEAQGCWPHWPQQDSVPKYA